MFINYIKTAWRSLCRNKTTTAINIVGLSAGITSAVLILLWVQNEVSYDTYHPAAERTYRLTTNLKTNDWIWETTPLLLADAIKNEVPDVESTTRLNDGNWPVLNINGELTYLKKCAFVDDNWFKLFVYKFTSGNANAFANDANSVVLTEAEARKHFGRQNALGATLRIDSTDYVVKGIVEDAPANSSFQYTAFIPLANLLKDADRRANDEQWSNANYLTFIRVKEGVSATAATQKISGVYKHRSGDNEVNISMLPLQDMHFDSSVQNSVFVRGNRSAVYIFSVLAFLLLLVACINYVNLTTAKASLRAKEVSVRKMIGAKRVHLFYQFITESLLVSFIAMLATIALVQLCLPWFNTITGKQFVISLTSLSMWQITGATLLAALLLNSIYPALLLSSFKPLNVFRGLTVLKVKDSYFRKGLVVVQFTISVALIASTIIIYKQMKFVQQSNPGYNRSQVLSFAVPPGIGRDNKESLMEALKHDLLTSSSIEGVTLSNQSIINIGSVSTGSADWTGHDTTFNPRITQLATDADFAKTMQLQLKEGRWFAYGNAADNNNVVLNEVAVAQLRIPTPVIGQRFSFKGRAGQIVGVVKNFTYQSMHDKTGPVIAFNDPAWFSYFTVRIAPHSAGQALAVLQKSWASILPGQPLEYNFLDDSFNELYQADKQASVLIFVFAIIAVVISALGLFGLAAFTAEQRTKEIGIRKVLGASVAGITTLLSRDFVKLVFIAIVIATPVSLWAMDNWIQRFAYRIDIVWWMFAAAGLLAFMIALATTSFQAFKAALANPVRSLRTE